MPKSKGKKELNLKIKVRNAYCWDMEKLQMVTNCTIQ